MKDSLSSDVYFDWKAESESVEVFISGSLVPNISSVSVTLPAGVSSPRKPRGVAPGATPFLGFAKLGRGVLNLLFLAVRACLLRVRGPGVMTSRSFAPASAIQAGFFDSIAVK